MARKHLRFRNFHPTTLTATDELFASRPWEGDEEEKATRFERWIRRASDAYGIPAPTFEITDDVSMFGSGGYALGQITLTKFSVILLFHQFRHHMQALGAVELEATGYPLADSMAAEDDAISWACSLFYKSRPALFRRLVRNGSIRYVRPSDLLARQRTDESDPMGSALDGDNEFEDDVQEEAPVNPTARLSTTEVMAALRRSRSWVCAHGAELGGEQDARGRWTFPASAITTPTEA